MTRSKCSMYLRPEYHNVPARIIYHNIYIYIGRYKL